MKTTTLASALALFTTLLPLTAGADDFTFGDSFDILDPVEIERVYEKLDPMVVALKPENGQWACRDVYLEEHCGDLDGCTVKLMLQHTVSGVDEVRGVNEHLYFENQSLTSNKHNSTRGYTRQSAGGEHLWQTGGKSRHTIFGPWGWAYMFNYRHVYCPDQSPGHGKPHEDPYRFTLISHPHVRTVAIIQD